MQSSAPYRINQAAFIEQAAVQNEVKLWPTERHMQYSVPLYRTFCVACA
jgi:hypothetical protein